MTRKKGDLVAVWTVYTASLEAENEALKKVIKELHDEIVAQDKEYKSLGNMNLKLLEENKKLREENAKLKDIIITDDNFEKKLDEEIKKLKEENEYRKKIVDIVPEWEGHIAEETIQDLQNRVKELKYVIDTLMERLE